MTRKEWRRKTRPHWKHRFGLRPNKIIRQGDKTYLIQYPVFVEVDHSAARGYTPINVKLFRPNAKPIKALSDVELTISNEPVYKYYMVHVLNRMRVKLEANIWNNKPEMPNIREIRLLQKFGLHPFMKWNQVGAHLGYAPVRMELLNP